MTITLIRFKDSMAYEEPKYQIITSKDIYEIREYGERLAAEIEYLSPESGFRYLFNYISGDNTSSKKIQMTVPVIQSLKIDMTSLVTKYNKNGKMQMQFFLPSKFTLHNAPKPKNKRVRLVVVEGGFYAVIKYSGRLTNQNFLKHYKKLKNQLIKDQIDFIEPAIRATYNGPFTLPVLRRNEIMIKVNYN